MTHLSPDQLQARLDDALTGHELEEADRHLGSCSACRDALAQLVAGDEALRDALTHDPGDAYFETFAARVEDRLRAEGLRGAQSRLGGDDRWFGWLRSPQKLAWVGGMAVVVAGAAIVLMTSREQRMPTLAGDARLSDRVRSTEQAPAPPPEPMAGTTAAPESDESPTAAKLEAESKAGAAEATAPSADRAPAPARLQPTTRNATGREVAVRDPRFATPPAPAPSAQEAAPRAEGEGTRVRRDRAVAPMTMQKSATEPVPAPLERGESMATAEGMAATCGTVTDAAGRALAGAVVVHVASGRSATSDAGGRFCLPEGTRGEVAVMAVGYEPARLSLGDEPLAATLAAVSVLEGGLAAREQSADEARVPATARTSAPSALSAPGGGDPFAGVAAASQALVRTARGATTFAGSTGSATAWDAAAAAWARVLPGVSGAAALEARGQAAEARYRAWKAAPTATRADAARRALAEYALRAPAGAAREQAVKRLAELGR